MELERASISINIRKGLLPVSFFYGIGVNFRNFLFQTKILKRKSFNVPIICIGNITVGGTGKTPHVEYILKLLKQQYKVAIISRGYKRKTSGFVLADVASTALDIGDEPYQIKKKYPDVEVAVDGDRVRGINKLLKLENPPDVIIMDDGLQHRYVKPSYNILLTDFNRPYYLDKLLPAGRLREKLKYKDTINDFFVTKCPLDLSALNIRLIEHQIRPYPFQGVFFTTFKYNSILSVFGNDTIEISELKSKHILLVTGIANPDPLIKQIRLLTKYPIKTILFEDHYQFKDEDIKRIEDDYSKLSESKIVLFTEKDAVRLLHLNLEDTIKKSLYYIPINVEFIEETQKKIFEDKILNHVKSYSRNS